MRRGFVLIFANELSQDYFRTLRELNEAYLIFTLEGATALYEQIEADLVIIDCGPFSVQGLHLLHLVKQQSPSMPVIFITDGSSEELVISAFKAGVRDFFKNPFNMNEFVRTIDRILALKRGSTNVHESTEASHLPVTIPRRLSNAIHFIDNNLANQINLEIIAQEACLSKFHFSRLFKKHIGISPMCFLMNRRIDHASTLLLRTELNILQVATRSGFNNLSEFHKQFRKLTGVTPAGYRKTLTSNQKTAQSAAVQIQQISI
jgi:YesN/AraC family two-component response regulator